MPPNNMINRRGTSLWGPLNDLGGHGDPPLRLFDVIQQKKGGSKNRPFGFVVVLSEDYLRMPSSLVITR